MANLDTNPKYNGLGNMQLGSGVDIRTGKIKYTGTKEKLMLFNGEIGYHTTAELYEDFTKFNSTKLTDKTASKSKASGSASVSYGIAKASSKLSYERYIAESNADGTIHKSVGVVKSKTYFFPYDYGDNGGDINETARLETAELILSSSKHIFNKISDIRNLIAELKKNTAEIARSNNLQEDELSQKLSQKARLETSLSEKINKFYHEYGTHFVSSVTKGHIGYFSMTFSYTGNKSELSSSMAGSVSVGAIGFASAQGGYSKSDAESFSKDQYSYESETYVFPNVDATFNSLNKLKEEVDKSISSAKSNYDFSNTTIDKTKLTYPELPDYPKIEEVDKEVSKQRASLNSKMINDLGQLRVNRLRFNEAPKTVEQKARLEILAEINKILLKFDAHGEYISLSLSRDQVDEVNKARVISQEGSNGLVAVENALKDLEQSERIEKERMESQKQDKTRFSKWLQQHHTSLTTPNKPCFSEWLKQLSAEDVVAFRQDWMREMEVLGGDDSVSATSKPKPAVVNKDVNKKETV